MTKDVLISLSGLQFDIDDEEVLEVISKGQYYIKNNKHYVIYKEFDEDNQGATSTNTIKLSPKQIDITKRGSNNVHMIFEEGKETVSYYETPFGSLLIGLSTSKITLDTSDDLIKARIHYDLSVNYTHVSECDITITVTAQ